MSRLILFNNAVTVPFDASPSSGSEITKPTDVAAGKLAAFDVDNFADGPLDLSAKATAKRIVFVQGASTGNSPIMSSIIDLKDVEGVYTKSYVAPVKQVTTVAVAQTAATKYLGVRVVEASSGYPPYRRISVTTKATNDATADAATLASLLNKNTNKFFTATSSTTNLVITGDEGVSFATSTFEDAEGWTVTATTAPNFGSGTYAHVTRLEEEAFGQQANFLNRTYLPVSPPGYAVVGKTYDLHVVQVKTNTTLNIALGHQFQEITIAVENEGSPSSGFESGIDLEVFFGFKDAPEDASEESPSSS